MRARERLVEARGGQSPSAAAPTVERKTSSVAIAILKPSAGFADQLRFGEHGSPEAQAGERMRRDQVDPLSDLEAGRVGIDDEGA